jgi:hypothetical protein
MENISQQQPSPGITRRKVLQRSALVGGALWAAPVVDSFVSRAAASSPPPAPLPVNNYSCPPNAGSCDATQSYTVTHSPLNVEFTNTSTCGGGYLEVFVNGVLAGTTSPCALPNGGTGSVNLGPQPLGASLTFAFVGCSGCTPPGGAIESWQGTVAFS